jgi:hypothetical protein
MGMSMPLEEVRSAQFGYQGRQVTGNNPQYGTVALRWWHGDMARLDMPINTWNITEFSRRSRGYKHAEAFLGQLAEQRHEDALICDFSQLIYVAVLNWILNTVGIVSDIDEFSGYAELWENHSASISAGARLPAVRPLHARLAKSIRTSP